MGTTSLSTGVVFSRSMSAVNRSDTKRRCQPVFESLLGGPRYRM